VQHQRRPNHDRVQDASALQLKTLTVHYVDAHVAPTVTGGGLTETATGEYVVVRISVTNTSSSSQSFADGAEQAELLVLNSNAYQTDTLGQTTANDAWAATVAPGGTQTGDLIFDVPKSIAASVPSRSVLGVTNYNETVSSPSSRQVGLLVLAH
jgi:hypothetical protein